jgi:cytochrome c553
MATGFLHLHITIVVVYIIFMAYKNILLLLGMNEKLAAFRAKTKIAEMIFGTLLLLTGGYLLYITQKIEVYMIVKIVILFAVIPLGIVGYNKGNKVLATLSTLLMVYAYLVAKSDSLTFNIGREKPTSSITESQAIDSLPSDKIINQNMENVLANAKPVFVAQCAICHGVDGKMMANGAKDLTTSTKTLEERIAIISNGKNLMPAFKYQLSEKDIQGLAIYTQMLKQE